ncbi:MAG: 4-alpha-glucanotransferase [Gammaproteobacteria bacterium]|nr:4-alpha-glucanotransferase [Gammaproteobacteria bacterium]
MNSASEVPNPGPKDPLLERRRAGVLLHPSSLPGEGAGGTLGPDAHRFLDVLAEGGMSVWQMLPLGPTHEDRSPYQCLSVHAGDPGLISRGLLEQWGWLDAGVAGPAEPWLARAQAEFERGAGASERLALDYFVGAHRHWLEDYALYQALRQEQGGRPWWLWPQALRDRQPEALGRARDRLAAAIARVRFEQFVFFRQWQELRQHAAQRDILLFGDAPIFVAQDSADVWVYRHYFALDEQGQPRTVAGVPPDYFSKTGQRWGNPLYQWEEMRRDGFRWWRDRLRTQLALFDLLRIDHFRGFESYWEIPAEDPTAVNGRWVKAPGEALFQAFREEFGRLPLVAEDLGYITEEVRALRDMFSLPGMRVLQFAFDGGPDNPYLPHRHEVNAVVYTGTHDNDTTLAWYDTLSDNQQSYVVDYLGAPADPMPWSLIRAALGSVAVLAVLPMQDVLALGTGNRMNTPGTITDNWQWRFTWDQLTTQTVTRLRHLARLYGRAADDR